MVSKVSDTMSDKKQKELWQYLSPEQLSKIQDPKLRAEYIKKRNNMVRCIINQLYMYAIRHGFDDTNFLKAQTISDMVDELKKFYNPRKIGIEDMEDIIEESIRTK